MDIGQVSFYGLFPIIVFAFSICGLTLYRSLARTNYDSHRVVGATLTIGASLLAIITEAVRWRQFDLDKLDQNEVVLSGLLKIDRISAIAIMVVSAIAIVATLISINYLAKRQDLPAAEFYILLQCAIFGMFAMAMANDFIALFVALEIFSIPLYVLTALDRRRLRSVEGGFKYFMMGAVSSAILLYGIALRYGTSGTTQFGYSSTSGSALAAIAGVLILIGMLFKVSAAPFHFWSPDSYQGAPTPVTVFMSATTKLVAFVALVRMIATSSIDVSEISSPLRAALTVACIASAIVGATISLRQVNMKRAIAYSSIAHSSFILLGLKAGNIEAVQAVLTYIVIYAFVVAGTFAVISIVSGHNEDNESINAYNGLAKTNPYLAGSLTILLLSQAGIPLTSGFIAKFEVFRVAFAAEFYITGIIVLICTVIAAAFYLRVVMKLYSNTFGNNNDVEKTIVVGRASSIGIGICVFITMAVGLLPALVIGFTHAVS